MIPRFDPERLEAFERLLAQPDPADLPTRAHAYRCAGDPARRATRLPAILMAWLQRRHLAVDVERRPAPAMRVGRRRARPPNVGLRVLRPTGTG
jgi:hypothetical protein